MSLTQELTQLNSQTCEKLTAPEMAVLQRASAMLRKSGISEQCLQSGESTTDFEFSANGQNQSLTGLLQKGPVLINFFRGYWCGFCKAELEAYNQLALQMQKLNMSYLAISPNTAEGHSNLSAHGQANNAYLINDPNNKIAKSFGIVYEVCANQKELFSSWGLDLAQLNQSDKWELPLAATYIISRNGCVEFSYVDTDFRKRLDPEVVISQMKELTTSKP